MANVTPARISYFVGDTFQSIRFHTVISEAHEASSEITKFPVQKGFQISNHAIRHNRKVVIEALITNTLLADSTTAYQYSSTDNNKTIFQSLRDLVNLRIKCTVITNLSEYTPVLFNSFKTKQMAGMVDTMKLTLIGEELQISNAINGAAPTPVSWVVVLGPDRVTAVDQLAAIDINVPKTARISKAFVRLGGDFSIRNVNALRQTRTTVYICNGFDPTTGAYNYDVHTSDTDLYKDPEELKDELDDTVVEAIEDSAGPIGVPNCLVEGVTKIATEQVEELLDTAAGKLKKSLRGAYYSTMAMVDSDVGQELIGLSAGCVIRGVTGHSSEYPYQPEESLPTTDQIMEGAKRVGTILSGPDTTAKGIPTVETELTQIIDI